MKSNLSIALNIVLAIVLVLVLFLGGDPKDKEVKKESNNVALENIMGRKSVRNFTDQKVSREQLDTLVRAAMAAPSARNAQPWAFVVIDDRAILDSLCEILPFGKMLGHASAAIAVCGDLGKALPEAAQTYWIQDCSAATENLLLAAEAIGLGAVWTGAFPIVERTTDIVRILGLPANIVPLNIIPIGYPLDPNEPAKDKYKPENIKFNKW